MIDKDEMMAVMLDACPSFAPAWRAFLDDWREEAHDLPLYVALGDLACHLIGLLGRGEAAELPAVFRAVERWHLEGDEYVREAATVGLLEGLQNLNLHTSTCPEQFRALLGPESARCWDDLAASWEAFFRWQEQSQQRLANQGPRPPFVPPD
jgi:hypothetical protein